MPSQKRDWHTRHLTKQNQKIKREHMYCAKKNTQRILRNI